MAEKRQRVVIVGAGFGGLECAKKLEGGPTDVLLVDRHNYHVFSPLLYQVASSLLNPSDIAYPVRRVFAGSPNVRFRQADVQRIDFEARELHCAGEVVIGYDQLVIAAGSTTNFFGNRAIEHRALGLKSLSEALQLRNHILGCLEAASACEDRDEQQAWMTFVIVGGGPTGVEYAGALAELMKLVLEGEYPGIAVSPRIVVVEGRDQLLGAFSKKLGDYAERRLEKLGVEVVTGTVVASADDRTVTLKNGEVIEARTLVWSAGVKPASLAAIERVPHTERSRRIEVDPHFRLRGESRVFAIGDIAGKQDADGGELPMLSAPAMQAGRYVGEFIMAHLSDPETESPTTAPFRYLDKGTMATIGRNAAVCSLGGLEMTGLLGWLAWLLVHIYYLIGYRNRLVVLWSWAWNYIWYDRPVRIITRAKRARLPHSPELVSSED
ncbi:MAG: NAD(P)/FAD-dependent oxidoreductase [Polyangiaceae bacterium]